MNFPWKISCRGALYITWRTKDEYFVCASVTVTGPEPDDDDVVQGSPKRFRNSTLPPCLFRCSTCARVFVCGGVNVARHFGANWVTGGVLALARISSRGITLYPPRLDRSRI